MARTATPAQTPANAPAVNMGALEVLDSAADELARKLDQQQTTVRAVALRMGYQLPGDAIDPDLIQRDIAANMRRSVEACLEVGRGLRVLKEACAHGEFSARLDVLGIEPGVASRFMQAASKFSNLPTSATLKAIGNQSKLFEMMVLDDEQIMELEATGSTGELVLDDVATMSVKELRLAVRGLREDKNAIEHLVAGKDKKLNDLTRQSKKFSIHTDWPQQVRGAVELVDELSRGLDISINSMMEVCTQALQSTPTDDSEQLVYASATEGLAVRVRDAMARQRELIEKVDAHFRATLGNFLAD